MSALDTAGQLGRLSHSLPQSRIAGLVRGAGHASLALLLTIVTYGLPVVLGPALGDVGSVAISVIAVAAPTVLLLQYDVQAYLTYWLSLVLLQNTVVGLWLPNVFQAGAPLVVTEAKTISLAIAVLMSLPQILTFLRSQGRLSIAVGIYLLWIGLSVRSFGTTTFAYGRNFVFPLLLLLFVASRLSSQTLDQRVGLLRRLIGFAVTILTIGVVSESIVGTDDWRTGLNVGSLSSLGGVSDTTYFFGVRVNRVAGFIIEPTNAGYIAATCAVLLLLVGVAVKGSRTPSWWLMVALSVALLVASSARSGFLMLALSLLAVVLSRFNLRPSVFFLSSCLSALAIVLVYVSIVKTPAAVLRAFSDPLSLVGGDSTTFHLAGLISGVTGGIGSIIGRGLGVGGNFSGIDGAGTALRGVAKIATGGESAWGVLSYQTGIVGLVLLMVVLIVAGRRWGAMSLAALTVWSVTSMFAEASFGLQVAALVMVGAALLRDDAPRAVEDVLRPGVLATRRTPSTRTAADRHRPGMVKND